jgi:hypothetical protein
MENKIKLMKNVKTEPDDKQQEELKEDRNQSTTDVIMTNKTRISPQYITSSSDTSDDGYEEDSTYI